MAAKLVAEEGIQKGLILSLDDGNEWVIGRDPDACQLLIEDPSASRKHLLCKKTPDGIFLQNLSTTNPVLINDEEVLEPRLLHNGDLVKIGAGAYRFYSEEEAQLLDQGEISQIINKDPNGNELNDQNIFEVDLSEKAKEPAKEESHQETSESENEEPEFDIDTSKTAEDTPAKAQETISPEKKPEPIENNAELPEFDIESETEEKTFQNTQEPNLNAHSEDASLEEPEFEIEMPPEEEIKENLENSSNMQNEGNSPDEKTEKLSNLEENVEIPEKNVEDLPETTEKSLEMAHQEGIDGQESKSSGMDQEAQPSEQEDKDRNEMKTIDQPTENEEILQEDLEPEHISIFDQSDEKPIYPEINFDLTETGRWLLKVVGGPNHGAEFTMQPASTYIIGTDPNSCDIVFHDTSVSRQHAKISVNEDETLTLEDLKSRNGTFVDGKPLTGKDTVPTNTLISMGTSSFVVYDREGEMQTIISPLLPSIVKVLKEEPKEPAPVAEQAPLKPVEVAAPAPVVEPPKKKEHAHDVLGAFILIAIITGLFVIIGIGTTTLFKSQPVVTQQLIHPDRDLTQALAAFPNVKYSFNRSTGRLLLVGHVLTASDKNQLLYNLQGLNYIRSMDDSGVIIDEGVWREINQVLSQNPNWKGISIHSPTPGHFVISGYLKTRKQAEQLWDYISSNFPYLDLLEKRVIVEEDVVTSIGNNLQNNGFREVSIQMNEGEVILSGTIPSGKMMDFDKALASVKDIPGVRNIKNFVTELAPEQSLINISDKYEITGVSHLGSVTSVVINGRILTRGDVLDGMTITSIKPNAVFLEKDGTKYRIDFSK